jgi:uncharacterized membrane protein
MNQKEILIKDYELTQAYIDKIDRFLFWIRNWTIVVCSGVIVFGVTKNERFVILTNIFILLVFLFLELIQKSFQENAMKHAGELEEIIQGQINGTNSLPKDYHFGIGHSLEAIKIKALFKILFNRARWHNLAFYLVILLFTFAAFFLELLV